MIKILICFSLHGGISHDFLRLLFQNPFSKYSFRNTIGVPQILNTDQARRIVGPGPGPNCCKGCQQTIIPVVKLIRLLSN